MSFSSFLFLLSFLDIIKLQGSMDSLYNCLWSIRTRFMSNDVGGSPLACNSPAKLENTRSDTSLHDPFSPTILGEERRKVLFESKFLRTLSTPVMSGITFVDINFVNVEIFYWPPNGNSAQNDFYLFIILKP